MDVRFYRKDYQMLGKGSELNYSMNALPAAGDAIWFEELEEAGVARPEYTVHRRLLTISRHGHVSAMVELVD